MARAPPRSGGPILPCLYLSSHVLPVRPTGKPRTLGGFRGEVLPSKRGRRTYPGTPEPAGRIIHAMSRSVVTVAIGAFEDLLVAGLRGLIEGEPSLQLVAVDVEPADLERLLRKQAPRVAILDRAS